MAIATPPVDPMQILKDYVPYGSTTWWTQQGYTNAIPNLGGWTGTAHSLAQELKVRGAAMNAFALAMVDPKNIVTARLVVALTQQHLVQGNTSKAQWGASWQSPLWAAWTGLAAMVGWAGIPYAHDRQRVLDMLEYEANYVLSSRPPMFWCKPDGTENYPGDSKAEENSWCATVLWVASTLMPTHPHRSAWQRHAHDLGVSAFARPGEDSRGYNVTRDGLIVNHNRVHPDYMTTITQNYFAPVLAEYLGREWNPEIIRQAPVLFDALVSEPLGDGTTIAYDPESAHISFPEEGNDWGTRRPAAHAVFAGLVDLFEQHYAANHYRSVFLADVQAMQLRPTTAAHPAGSFVADTSEANYGQENAYVASQVAFLALAEKVVK